MTSVLSRFRAASATSLMRSGRLSNPLCESPSWKPIRQKQEGAGRMYGSLHLAQAQSNRARRGRKRDFPDAERMVKRLVARELTLSFVPDAEQRLWRTVTRRKYQLTRDHVRLQNQVE